MHIENARNYMVSLRVDDFRACALFEIRTDCGDLFAGNSDIGYARALRGYDISPANDGVESQGEFSLMTL